MEGNGIANAAANLIIVVGLVVGFVLAVIGLVRAYRVERLPYEGRVEEPGSNVKLVP